MVRQEAEQHSYQLQNQSQRSPRRKLYEERHVLSVVINLLNLVGKVGKNGLVNNTIELTNMPVHGIMKIINQQIYIQL